MTVRRVYLMLLGIRSELSVKGRQVKEQSPFPNRISRKPVGDAALGVPLSCAISFITFVVIILKKTHALPHIAFSLSRAGRQRLLFEGIC